MNRSVTVKIVMRMMTVVRMKRRKPTDVEEKIEDPKIGMIFDFFDEVHKYYAEYAKQNGFTVSKSHPKTIQMVRKSISLLLVFIMGSLKIDQAKRCLHDRKQKWVARLQLMSCVPMASSCCLLLFLSILMQ